MALTELASELKPILSSQPSTPRIESHPLSPSSDSFNDITLSRDALAVYHGESLRVQSGKDFRLLIPVTPRPGRRCLIEWNVMVLPEIKGATGQTIGFSILRKRADGLLPQVEPYR
jgi:hypothetical protein